MKLDREFTLFQHEGYLIRDTLCTGLTALRNTRPPDKGGYYKAFFSLSIGTERLLKIIVILEYLLKNNFRYPTNKELKAFGHDLLSLYRAAEKISPNYPESVKNPFSTDKINLHIVQCLAEFAKETRYYNLDQLTQKTTTEDPVAYWNEIFFEVFMKDVPLRRQQIVLHQSEGLGEALKDIMTAIITDLNRQTVGLKQAFLLGGMAREANPYLMWRMIQILDPMKALLWDLSSACQEREKKRVPSVPYMVEFLDFIYPEKAIVLRKKRWP